MKVAFRFGEMMKVSVCAPPGVVPGGASLDMSIFISNKNYSKQGRRMNRKIEEISDLVGEEISTVAFVRDYVEFHFDGPILRSIANPFVSVDGKEYRFPNSGSRDALCQMIGSTVQAVRVEKDHICELTTSNNCRITIPLDVANLRGGEAMHFISEADDIQVWW